MVRLKCGSTRAIYLSLVLVWEEVHSVNLELVKSHNSCKEVEAQYQNYLFFIVETWVICGITKFSVQGRTKARAKQTRISIMKWM